MKTRSPRYDAEEFERRGQEIYERDIRSQVEPDNTAKIVAIDIESGAFAVGANVIQATRPLFDKDADAQIWLVRVGHRAIHRIGSGSAAGRTC